MGSDLPEGWQQPACVNHPDIHPQWKCRACKSLIGEFLSWAVSLYFLFLQMRILGILFYCNQKKLNWFPALDRKIETES